jgi:hypothetical protein
MSQRHLLVDISGHGYGHAAMTIPVLNELARRAPDLRITVRSAISRDFLDSRLDCNFEHIPAAFDFGMVMANALDVQVAESMAAYREFHRDWHARVEQEARTMRMLKPDLLLANVPYLSLAAARRVQIPAVGMCCLIWADIYRHYANDDDEAGAVYEQMLDAYNSADLFLRAQPAMPMSGLENLRDIGPVARVGRNRRNEIVAWERVDRLVLVAMGGIEFRLPMENWPRIDGVHWLVPRAWNIEREDISGLEQCGLSFSDVLASCDAIVTKPGYGTFAEAACAGIPVLYVSRCNWPEEPYLVQWLQQNGVCREVERAALQEGEIEGDLGTVLAAPLPAAPSASGVVEAADSLLALL